MKDRYCCCGEYLGSKTNCDAPGNGCGWKLNCNASYFHYTSLGSPGDKCEVCGRIALQVWLNLQNVNWKNKDRVYWRDLFRRCENETYGGDSSAEEFIKWRRYDKRRPRAVRGEDAVKDYGLIYGSFINRQLRSLTEGLDCVSDERFADVNSRADMKRFKKRRSCCGSAEKRVSFLGRTFLIGCNYGH